jgi:hypothetical protein
VLYQQYTAGEEKIGKGQREVPNIEIDFTIRNRVLLKVIQQRRLQAVKISGNKCGPYRIPSIE